MAEESQAPATGDQPSTAAPSGAGEGGGEGGGSMPLIIGGVVVLLLLVGVGAAVAFTGGSGSTTAEPGGSGATGTGGPDSPNKNDPPTYVDPGNSVDLSKWTYFGVKVGDISNTQPGVGGEVFAATEYHLVLRDFSYDPTGAGANFMVGTTDEPDENGEVVHDAKKSVRRKAAAAMALEPVGGASLQGSSGSAPTAGKLRKYERERVLIKLSKPIKDYKYFAVYSKEEKKSYGTAKIESTFTPPAPVTGDSFTENGVDHEIKSTANIFIDSKHIQIKGFHFKGNPPETFFSVGNGDPDKDEPIKIGPEAMLEDVSGKDYELTLPGDDTWDKYQWMAVYCFSAKANFAHFNLPDDTKRTMPVYLGAGSRRRRAVQRRLRLGSSSSRVTSGLGKPKVLVCTFGEFGVKLSMVPPDGMCEVVFFTDVEYDKNEDTIVPRDGGPAFGVLKSAAKKYTKTTFGTSMSTGTIADVVKDKEAELKTSMEELFSAGLHHFGMLNVENIESYEILKSRDLKYLKVVAKFLKTKMPQRHYHNALGISLRDASKGDKILEVAKRAPHDFTGLTMIVVKLHTENVNNGGDHWPVAPNPDDVVLIDHNAFSLAVIKDDVKRRLTDIAAHGRYAMLSFAMYARTYRMKATWSEVSVREMSESSLNMDYPAVCKMKAAKDSSDAGTMYAADQHKKFLALFDSPVTFKAKTKARLSVMPKNFTGLAAYNVEMDDYKNACGKGRFPRLQAIKAALAA